jgi:exosortase E/protease (VPEID-CTERM system)
MSGWKACVLVLLGGEALFFGLWFDLGKLGSILTAWPGEPGIQILTAVSLVVAGAALVFGRSRAPSDFQPLLRRLRSLGRPVPFLAIQVVLFFSLVCLTARIQDGGELYWNYRLRYAVGWLLVALLTVTFSVAPLLPAGFWERLLPYGFEALVAVALAGAIVCVGLLSHPLWWLLNQSTFESVHWCLNRLLDNVVYQPDEAVLGTPSFTVQIACPCGGAEGIGLILIFLSVYLWLFRAAFRFPSAFLLFPLGVGLIWVANVLRITTMVLLGTWQLAGLDVDGFHAQAGWVAFLGISLGLVVLTQRSAFFRRDQGLALFPALPRATVAYVGPLLAIVAIMFVSRVFSDRLDWLYPVRVLAAGLVLWFCRSQYTELRWSWSWLPVALGIGVFLLWIGLERFAPVADAGLSLKTAWEGLPVGWATVWLIFRLLGSVVTVPLAEELAFRGYLTRRLIAADFRSLPPGSFTWFSCLASSFLFGVMHGRWLAGTLAGLIYALALYRRGKLADAVVAHALTNALLAGYVLATGDWSFWMY